MAKMGKKYIDSSKLIEKAKAYEVAEAMDLVCQTAKAKFDETVEVLVETELPIVRLDCSLIYCLAVFLISYIEVSFENFSPCGSFADEVTEF